MTYCGNLRQRRWSDIHSSLYTFSLSERTGHRLAAQCFRNVGEYSTDSQVVRTDITYILHVLFSKQKLTSIFRQPKSMHL
jgi:hypothetical protein